MVLLLVFLQGFLQELQNVSMFNFFVISSIFIASAFSLLMCNNRFRNGRHHELNTPPSPPKLPIIGNLHQLGTQPHRSLQALSKKYGPLMLIHIGTVPTLVISSPELVKEMIKSHDIIFSNRPQITAAKLLLYDHQDIVFANYGEHWRQGRKICTIRLLTTERVHSFRFIREEEVECMVKKIRSTCGLNGSSSHPINLTEMIMSVSNNVIIKCAFGKRSGIKEDDQKSLIELSQTIVKLIGSFSFGDSIPWLGWLDVLTGLVPTMKKKFKEWDSCMDQLIEEHKISTNEDNHNQGFVDILLQLLQDEDSNHFMNLKMMKALLLDMLIAGTESSSTTIEWLIAHLMKNPTKMKKAQEEVRRVIGKKAKIERSDFDQMEYLKCVIKETLRLNLPGPLLVPRVTSSNVKLGGYDISANTHVITNAWAIQRDPKVWGEDAEAFIPERFENNPIDFRGNDFELMPFGGGRRQCPGLSFAILTVEYTVVYLLYWFDWALPEGLTVEKFHMNEVFKFAAPRKGPLCLVPTVYSP